MVDKPEEVKDIRVIDCDSHIIESPEDFEKFLEPGYKLPMIVKDIESDTRYWVFDGKLYTRPFGFAGGQIRGLIDHTYHPKWGLLNPKLKAKNFSLNDIKGRLIDLDEMGVDFQVVNPKSGLIIYNLRDKRYAAALARAYNNYVANRVKESGTNRIYANAIVPLQDLNEAVRELERVKDLGVFKGVAVPTFVSQGNFYADKPIYHEDFFPFFKRAAELNMPVAIHVIPAVSDMPFMYLFYNWLQVRTFGFSLAAMIGLTGLISEGLFERIPNLRVIFTETGVGWLPYWSWWLDENLEKINSIRKSYLEVLGMDPYPYVKKLASEYISAGNIFVTVETDDDPDLLRLAINKLNLENNILFATDYPHIADISYYPDNLNIFIESVAKPAGLTNAQIRKILQDNAQQLFGLET
ncbi:MAG: amidohydrolase family protein [Saccharolobus sp.]|uniref:amidohydrolase family protein n=1 Tax=Saccharolobus sp. TaxID=2100761 RepID=UPI003175A5FB